jgi:hypothetical protein
MLTKRHESLPLRITLRYVNHTDRFFRHRGQGVWKAGARGMGKYTWGIQEVHIGCPEKRAALVCERGQGGVGVRGPLLEQPVGWCLSSEITTLSGRWRVHVTCDRNFCLEGGHYNVISISPTTELQLKRGKLL